MIPSAIIGRYGRSLAEVALEKGEEAAITRDFSLYRDIFQTVPDLLVAFDSPAVPRDAKERILTQLIEAYPVISTMANFLRVLLDHNRIRFCAEIFDLYLKTVNERAGIVAAQVTSAGPVSAENMSRLRELLSTVTGKNVTLAVQTDPGLLGGLVIQIGSTVYDGSVRTQLAEMKQRLMA
jgi:F-type H+-transporting ATPase subunit delta